MTPPDPMDDPAWAFYRQGVEDGLRHARRLGPALSGGISWRAHSQLPGDQRHVDVVVEAVDTVAGGVAWAVRVEQSLARWSVKFAGGRQTVYAADEEAAKAASDLPDAWAYQREVVTLAVALPAETLQWLETIAAQNQIGIRETNELVQHILGGLAGGARRPGSWERGILERLVGEPPSGWGLPERGAEAGRYRRPLTGEGLNPRDWTQAVAETIAGYGPLSSVPLLAFPEGDAGMHWLLAFLHAAVCRGDQLRAAGWLMLLSMDLGAVDCELMTEMFGDVQDAVLVATRYTAGPTVEALKWFTRDLEDTDLEELRSAARALFAALCAEGEVTHAG